MGIKNFVISVYLPLKMWYYGNIGKLEKSLIEEINLSSLFCAFFEFSICFFLKNEVINVGNFINVLMS